MQAIPRVARRGRRDRRGAPLDDLLADHPAAAEAGDRDRRRSSRASRSTTSSTSRSSTCPRRTASSRPRCSGSRARSAPSGRSSPPATIIVIIPTLVVFLLLQRFIYNGFTAGAASEPTPRRTPLHDGWTLASTGPATASAGRRPITVPATVPGLRAHRPARRRAASPDPYLDDNELAVPGSGASTGVTADVRRRTGPSTSGSTWSSTASTRSRPSTLNGDDARPRPRTAPHLPLRRHRRCSIASRQRADGRASTLRRHHAERGPRPARRARPTRTHAVQLHPQDGVQLRLGLGSAPDEPGIWRPVRPGTLGTARGSRGPSDSRLSADAQRASGSLDVTVDVERRPRRDTAATVRATSRRRTATRRAHEASPRRRQTVASPSTCPTSTPWWPAATATSRCTTRRRARRRRHGARPRGRGRRLPHRSLRHRRAADGAVHARRQRPAGSSSRASTGSPTTASRPGRPASSSPAARPGRRRRRQPDPGVGRRHLRDRRVLRGVRRAGCWSGRTSCSPAPRTPRRSRCAPRSRPRPARTSPG